MFFCQLEKSHLFLLTCVFIFLLEKKKKDVVMESLQLILVWHLCDIFVLLSIDFSESHHAV